MKVLIVDGDEREHATAWKTVQGPRVERLYRVPGDTGVVQMAERVDIDMMDFGTQVAFAKKHGIDLVVMSPDNPLVVGVMDAFETVRIKALRPRKSAVILKGSKVFSEDLMKEYDIPMAGYKTFDSPEGTPTYIEHASIPIVLKADGLTLGKGVLICNTREGAKSGVKTPVLDKQLGSAGNRIVVGEFTMGRKISVPSFADRKTIKVMILAQDHRRAKDGDQGLNAGGMGAFSPNPFYTEEVDPLCRNYTYQSTVGAMRTEGRGFQGIVFFGLTFVEQGPKALGYNARLGDPETQVILPRMRNNTVDVFEACVDGMLDQVELGFRDNAAVCVALASVKYPEHYGKGYKTTEFESFKNKNGCYVFHIGSKFDTEGSIVTNGERVLGVTAKGAALKEVKEDTCKATEWIEFGNEHMKHGIGKAVDEA